MTTIEIGNKIPLEKLPNDVFIIKGSHDLNDGDNEATEFKEKDKSDIEIGIDFINHCNSKGYDSRISDTDINSLTYSFITEASEEYLNKLKIAGIYKSPDHIKNAADRLHDHMIGTYYRIDDCSDWLPLEIDSITYFDEAGISYNVKTIDS